MDYDVIVVGTGHAGCEAALAAARLGARTLAVTLNPGNIGHMPCNCSIGGPAKGHVVREIDALGGEMAVNTDLTLTHMRMLNTSKGPAVQTLRAQADKQLYPDRMSRVLNSQRGLTIAAGVVTELILDRISDGAQKVRGVRCQDGQELHARCVVVTTGTFLRGVCHVGDRRTPGGRHEEPPASSLSESLRAAGLETARFKTGTTPRIDFRSIDLARTAPQASDPEPECFSYLHDRIEANELLPCWETHTTEATHQLIRENLHLSAMYGGHITGKGPRYCPSIEDKLVRFPDRSRHTIFLEREGWSTDWVYVQGLSTSLPSEIQEQFLRTIPGLEECIMLRAGYAVEYDAVLPTQLHPSLETRAIQGLFLAGQINGTSGYEEAAGQGLIAGINAARLSADADAAPFVLDRASSYIGVMIDDLVTRGADEPYRLLTSRAEHRLILRHDNADLRLTPVGRSLGLVTDERWGRFQRRLREVAGARQRVAALRLQPGTRMQGLRGEIVLDRQAIGEQILKRADTDAAILRSQIAELSHVPAHALRQVEIESKYRGYIERQQVEIERQQRLESRVIPDDFDYGAVRGLSHEGRERLSDRRPRDIGQAARIPGITPADVSILIVAVEAERRRGLRRPSSPVGT